MQSCSVCGETILGNSYSNYWGESYCGTHKDDPRCFSCHRIISPLSTGGGMKFRDGRHMCNICRKTAVLEPIPAAHLLRQVRRFLASKGLELGDEPIPVRLGAQSELADISSSPDVPFPLGLACKQWLAAPGSKWRPAMKRILIQYGIPEEQFTGVLAHEFGHAWFFLKGYEDIPRVVEEGFCELCASLWYHDRQTPEAKYHVMLMARNADPTYGEGFRLARRALSGRSLHELALYIGSHRAFPPSIPVGQLTS